MHANSVCERSVWHCCSVVCSHVVHILCAIHTHLSVIPLLVGEVVVIKPLRQTVKARLLVVLAAHRMQI